MQKHRSMLHLTISQKYIAIAVLAVLTTAVSSIIALDRFYMALGTRVRAEIQHEVEQASSMVGGFVAEYKNGKISKEEAERRAFDALRPMRFAETGYIFALRLDGTMALDPPSPKLEGSNMLEEKDVNGRHFFKDMLELGKANQSGFVDYNWPRPGKTEAVAKTTYLIPIPELGIGNRSHPPLFSAVA